jgi:hypothetical protein
MFSIQGSESLIPYILILNVFSKLTWWIGREGLEPPVGTPAVIHQTKASLTFGSRA